MNSKYDTYSRYKLRVNLSVYFNHCRPKIYFRTNLTKKLLEDILILKSF